ncbi:MAG: BlaI/MecI/CopY family transcriptional regulator [Candidatus Hydrogenedentes bacterium]|nr:BlaI/MecI/CopY family transcriptional regulator [Candidatus Hydrogenedentota bacterium]
MLRKQHGLGELELAILKTVWQFPGSTVQELTEILAKERACARTTILTVVQRLHSKGFLKRKKVDGVFRFSPTEDRGEVISRLIRQFVEKVLDGSAAPFVAYLANTKNLTEDQASQLQTIVEQLEKNEEGR